MIPSLEAIKAINSQRGDAVVVATSAALMEWSSISLKRELDLDISDCMDKASSVGLGVALAHPDRQVLVLDSDSVLRANLGSLITVGAAAPKNLVHFLFQDCGHAAANWRQMSGLAEVDFSALADDGGYSRTYIFDDLEDMVLHLQELLESPGPTFVTLKVARDEGLRHYRHRNSGESFAAVKDALVHTTKT